MVVAISCAVRASLGIVPVVPSRIEEHALKSANKHSNI
jgi:hypothetical protein